MLYKNIYVISICFIYILRVAELQIINKGDNEHKLIQWKTRKTKVLKGKN